MCCVINSVVKSIKEISGPEALYTQVMKEAEIKNGYDLGSVTTLALGILAAMGAAVSTGVALGALFSGVIPTALVCLGITLFLVMMMGVLYVATDCLAKKAMQTEKTPLAQT